MCIQILFTIFKDQTNQSIKCISLRKQFRKDMKYPEHVLPSGETMDLSESEEWMEERDCIIPEISIENSDVQNQNPMKRKRSYTQGLVVQNKRGILKGKSKISRKITQTIKFTGTLGQDSTIRGKTLKPFWNESCKELSEKLLFPTEIDYVGTDLNSSNRFVGSMGRKSWSTSNMKQRDPNPNCLRISWPSVISSSRKTMVTGKGKTKSVKSRKMKLILTQSWKERLNKWMGTCRWIYNRCLSMYKKKKCGMNMKDYRSRVSGAHLHGKKKQPGGKTKKKRGKKRGNWNKPKGNPPRSKTEWVLETPTDVRDLAIMSLIDSYTSNEGKKKINPEHVYDFKFRKKNDVQTIRIKGSSITKNGILYPRFTNKEPLKAFEDFSGYSGEIKIQKDRCGDFWLIVQEEVKNSTFGGDKDDLNVCALDPGVRTFNTVVDSNGNVLEFAPGDIGRIYRLCSHMDKLQSRAFDMSINSKKRYRLRRAWHRMIRKIKNLVLDIHRKAVCELTSRYDVVFIPEFNTKGMVNKASRKIGSKTSRAMMTWSHYRFRQMLKSKAVLTGTNVVVVTEEFTSKTCSCCGLIKNDLGRSKIYNCRACKRIIDRDENGARNILIKSIIEQGMTITFSKISALNGDRKALGPTPSAIIG